MEHEKLLGIEDYTILHVFTVRTRPPKHGKTQDVLACSKDGTLCITSLLLPYTANYVTTGYTNKNRDKWARTGCEYPTCYNPTFTRMFSFRKVGYYCSDDHHKYANIEIVPDDYVDNVNTIRPLSISRKACVKIYHLVDDGTIKEGDSITITGRRDMEKMLLLEISHKNKAYNVYANY
jgi:hypothetical protein